MAKATLTLPSGTIVVIEGTAEEVHRLLELHETSEHPEARRVRKAKTAIPPALGKSEPGVPIHEIVNQVRSCEDAERIEKSVLDGTSQVDHTLLPLYIVQKYFDDAFALAAAEIAEICKQLRVRVVQENVSKMLRGPASKFVIVESAGPPKKFKINRRGLQYMTTLLSGRRRGDANNRLASTPALS